MLTTLLAVSVIATQPLPPLGVDGKHLKDPQGRAVTLKGTNLGNWLVIEPWMMDMTEGDRAFKDQVEMERILADRFGDAERERLMDLWRASWITPRDFRHIREFGFNLVRLPMNYRLFEDDARPMVLRKDAFEWIDRAVDWAEKEGIYVILDMHGVQGGQSVYDHTGQVGQNKLWSVPENQDRLAWLWGKIAERYRKRSAVVAYDVFNEPYGGTKQQQVAVFRKVLPVIRKADPDKLVLAHGNWDDFTHYGDPKANGWRNVGFQMHYYPGLFGNGEPTLLTQARHLGSLPGVAKKVDAWNVPFLVGEMNVVFARAGGGWMMRKTFDDHARYGWMTTMWSYRTTSRDGGLGPDAWCMVTNAKPKAPLNLRTAAKTEVERWFRAHGTEPLVKKADLFEWMTKKNPVFPPLPELPKRVEVAPAQESLPGFEQADLGGSLAGGLKQKGDGFVLYGGGEDVWGSRDQCRFLYQSRTGDFTLRAVVRNVPDVDQYSKGGLMVRESLEPDAPTTVLTLFSSAEAQFAVREPGLTMAGRATRQLTFPAEVELSRRGSEVIARVLDQGAWVELGRAKVATPRVFLGAIALSHDNAQLIGVEYGRVTISE